MSKVILFQGDSITDCGRDRNVSESIGTGYPRLTAAKLGFENPDCFAKMFKRIRGITPYQYRKYHPYVGNRSSIKD